MKSKEKKKDALAILGKTLLYIVAVAMAFAFIILAWEKYDWLPTVKEIIRGVIIPMLLGGLTVFFLRHEDYRVCMEGSRRPATRQELIQDKSEFM